MKKGLAQVLEPRYAEFWNGEAWMKCGFFNLCAFKSHFQILARWRGEVARHFHLDCWPGYAASVSTGCVREELKALALGRICFFYCIFTYSLT